MAQGYGDTVGPSAQRADVRPQVSFDTSGSNERIREIGAILALGLVRVLAGKSSGQRGVSGESSLDFSAIKSGYPMPVTDRGSDA
jgi:hypothetical protein